MRIKRAIFAGIVAALASLTAPALASHSKPQPVARAAGVIVLQRDAADAGWNVAAAAVSGNGFPAASPAQIRGAKSGAADALRHACGPHGSGRASCPAVTMGASWSRSGSRS